MRSKLVVASALALLAASGTAPAANPNDPWAYCWAQTKGAKKFIYSAPMQVASSDRNALDPAWQAFAQQKLGGALERAACNGGYAESAAPEALKMHVDQSKAAGKPVEMTGWVWGQG
ncbi:hypothetical protein [Lysobacter humi (ex Lee et al. 2017)]